MARYTFTLNLKTISYKEFIWYFRRKFGLCPYFICSSLYINTQQFSQTLSDENL